MLDMVNALMNLACRMPGPLDAFDLLRLAFDLLETSIDVVATTSLLLDAPGLLIRRPNRTFRIVYRLTPSLFSNQMSILHELSHILLFHRQTPWRASSQKSVMTDSEEREAERAAYQLMDFLINHRQNPVLTRFVRLIEEEEETDLREKTDSRPALRFRGLIGN